MQTIETLTTEQATERLRSFGMAISPQAVRDGIQQKIFPFGDCIVSDRGRKFLVYRVMLDRWIEERASGDDHDLPPY